MIALDYYLLSKKNCNMKKITVLHSFNKILITYKFAQIIGNLFY